MENEEITPYEFLASDEFYKILDEIEKILKIDFIENQEKSLSVTYLIDKYFRNNFSIQELANLFNQEPKILTEEEIDILKEFISQNLEPIKIKLFKNLPISFKNIQPISQSKPQSFEEKAKKYEEIMSSVVKPSISTLKKEESKKEAEPSKIVVIASDKEKIKEEKETLKKEETFQTPIQTNEKVVDLKSKKEKQTILSLEKPPKEKEETIEKNQNKFEQIDKNNKSLYQKPESSIIILKKSKTSEEDENVLDLSNL